MPWPRREKESSSGRQNVQRKNKKFLAKAQNGAQRVPRHPHFARYSARLCAKTAEFGAILHEKESLKTGSFSNEPFRLHANTVSKSFRLSKPRLLSFATWPTTIVESTDRSQHLSVARQNPRRWSDARREPGQ